jgi:hypothetical protein
VWIISTCFTSVNSLFQHELHILFSWDRILLCKPVWPWTHYLPTSASWVLGLQVMWHHAQLWDRVLTCCPGWPQNSRPKQSFYLSLLTRCTYRYMSSCQAPHKLWILSTSSFLEICAQICLLEEQKLVFGSHLATFCVWSLTTKVNIPKLNSCCVQPSGLYLPTLATPGMLPFSRRPGKQDSPFSDFMCLDPSCVIQASAPPPSRNRRKNMLIFLFCMVLKILSLS